MKIGKIIMLSMIGVAAMVSCSEDELGNDNKEYGTLQPVVGTFPGEKIALSRAETTPAWYLYEELYPLSLENEPTIGIFMTQGDVPMTDISGKFVYRRDELTKEPRWISDIAVEDGTVYNIFGYMSANNKSWDADIDPNGTYNNGAIMKLQNLNVVTASDVSAVVGILKGNMDDSGHPDVMRETIDSKGKNYGSVTKESYLGSYNFVGEKNKNFIYLWLDHLYTCINFELNMDDEYGELRIIKLKQVNLTVSAVKMYDVTVTLGTDNYNPITSVTYVPTEGAATDTTSAVLFKNVEGKEIPKVSEGTRLNVPGYFAPVASFTGDTQTMEVTFTYDLYTVNSNGEKKLEAAGRTAKNTIKIGELLKGKTLDRGKIFTVRATVQPSYLYVLADEDLNNPVFRLEVEP